MMRGPLYRHHGRTFHPWLVCDVDSVTYDYATRVGVIHVPKGHSTDCSGAIALGKRLDPQVREIHVYAGERLDIVYRRDGKGWRAYDVRRGLMPTPTPTRVRPSFVSGEPGGWVVPNIHAGSPDMRVSGGTRENDEMDREEPGGCVTREAPG